MVTFYCPHGNKCIICYYWWDWGKKKQVRVSVCVRRRVIGVTPVSHKLITLLVMLTFFPSFLISLLSLSPLHLPSSSSPPSVLLCLSLWSCFQRSSWADFLSLSDLANPLQISLQQMVLCLHWARSPSNPVSLSFPKAEQWRSWCHALSGSAVPTPPLSL